MHIYVIRSNALGDNDASFNRMR